MKQRKLALYKKIAQRFERATSIADIKSANVLRMRMRGNVTLGLHAMINERGR